MSQPIRCQISQATVTTTHCRHFEEHEEDGAGPGDAEQGDGAGGGGGVAEKRQSKLLIGKKCSKIHHPAQSVSWGPSYMIYGRQV